MIRLQEYADSLLSRGRAYFSKDEAVQALNQTPQAFTAAAARQIKKGNLVSPKRGFYLILRPEDRQFGAPDPAQWIDPLMKFMGVDYRISLLRAAAFHGSSHQAAMAFQVIAPKQFKSIEIGRHRIQFIYQAGDAFGKTNRPEWLGRIKSPAGYATVAGVELTLLDSARYFHKAAGINGAAQIAHDLGPKANPRILGAAAGFYENSSVRRLGYLLDHFKCERAAHLLLPFAEKAKSLKPLDPSAKPLAESLSATYEKSAKWKLVINEPVEIDE